MQLGYHLSCEEHPPEDLVRYAVRAEEVGFEHGLISDHFHPWLEVQGQSPFVWAVIGAIGQATERIRLGTGVTCPMIRMHPALVAQAAATSAVLLPGRFFLGVGSGENLNEHVTGERWPPADVRLDMLAEAIEVIRTLWTGREVTHRGDYYRVEDARLYTLPETPPDLYVAAMGPRALELAGRVGDGLITIVPQPDAVDRFHQGGGSGKPAYVKVTVCWAPDEGRARETALRYFGQAAIGAAMTELRTPGQFEAVVSALDDDRAASSFVLGPDSERYLAAIREAVDAGFDHVYLHQIGPDQDGFFDFYAKEIAPKL